jgi:hypothetical protein
VLLWVRLIAKNLAFLTLCFLANIWKQGKLQISSKSGVDQAKKKLVRKRRGVQGTNPRSACTSEVKKAELKRLWLLRKPLFSPEVPSCKERVNRPAKKMHGHPEKPQNSV